jgi:hypothetical protein
MAYLLDANVFIAAKNLHYGLDFCPAFWAWLTAENAAGNVYSVEKVGDELQAVADELSNWAAARGSAFFLPPDATVVPALGVVSNWAMSGPYSPSASSTFLQVADYYVIEPPRVLPRAGATCTSIATTATTTSTPSRPSNLNPTRAG